MSEDNKKLNILRKNKNLPVQETRTIRGCGKKARAMIYNKFNKYIHSYYFNSGNSGNIGSSLIMSIDDIAVKDFCSKSNISEDDLKNEIQNIFRVSWNYALQEYENIPNMFGFVAIQIYIAHLMDKDGKYTAGEYNPRLSDYIGSTPNKLQFLYRNHQDAIWSELNKWITNNNFISTIPKARTGKGRYISYPLSQVLLNRKDLKNITTIPY